ncbi:MAG: Lon protease [Aeriscardovia sp.]|nr:Lon protease [Aeriscardovia sp.]
MSFLHRKVSTLQSVQPSGEKCHWWRRNVGWVLFVALAACLFLPTNYVIEMPGPTMNVLGRETLDNGASGRAVTSKEDTIRIAGAPVKPTSGKLLMVTVNVEGSPRVPINAMQTLAAWFHPQEAVMPREVVFPIGETTRAYDKQISGQMSSAQGRAQSVALKFIAQRHLANLDDPNIKIDMSAGDVGGPSAGMMFALGIIDKLTSGTMAGNQTIAGTGTISAEEQIGKIGGIRLKMLGARRDGASWFLAPSGNCSDVVGYVPAGLRVVKVSTLLQAYNAVVAIGQGQGADLPTCTA